MSLWSRFQNLIDPEPHRDEIHEELDFHLEMDQMHGHSSRNARLRLGNPTRIAEETSEMRTIPALGSLWRDLRQSAHSFAKSKTMTAAVITTLAFGIGATTAIFSVVNGVLIQPLNFPDPDRLVAIWHLAPGIPGNEGEGRLANCESMYFTYRDHNETFEQFGLWGRGSSTANGTTGAAEPEQLMSVWVTKGTLDALGVQPLFGRWFTQEDDTPGSAETVILSNAYWQRAFGGDTSVIDRALNVDGRPRQIVGVMPASFRFPDRVQPQIILPMRINRAQVYLGGFADAGVARLKPGVTLEQANADVARMIEIWLNEWPPFPGTTLEIFRRARFTPDISMLKSDVVGSIGDLLWILMGAIGLVLLIACANVANLMLVRTDGRRQELAIRAALGASWSRIAYELLAESVALSLLGGLLGLGIAWAGLRVLLTYIGSDLPRAAEISIDPRVLVFALLVSCLSGLLFGLVPVIRYARPRIAGTLSGSGRTLGQSRERHRSRNALVVLQVALALVVLVGSGLMIRTFLSLRAVEPGFDDPNHLQALRISIPVNQVQNPEEVMRMHQAILEHISAIPGVESAALVSSTPMEGLTNDNTVWIRDQNYAEGEIPPLRRYKFVSPGVFQTLGTPILAGRDYTWTDLYDLRPVAIVSESFARETWGDAGAALGHFIRALPNNEWREIVGVVGDVSDDGVDQPAPAIVYWPALNEGFFGPETAVQRGVAYLVRTDRAGTEAFLDDTQQAVWSVNANLPLSAVRTMGDVYQTSLARTFYTLVLLSVAGLMALLLGIVGIYGVVSYAVSQRTREIGIRMALGASLSGIRHLFTREAVGLVAIGTIVGLAAALGLTRLMASILFGVTPLDPVTFVSVSLLLIGVAILASYVPTRRALRVDPMETLRQE